MKPSSSKDFTSGHATKKKMLVIEPSEYLKVTELKTNTEDEQNLIGWMENSPKVPPFWEKFLIWYVADPKQIPVLSRT